MRFIIPTGSLAGSVRTFLRTAGYDVGEPDRRGYCGVSNGIEFHQLDRRTVPEFLKTGLYDAGITGRDLLIASGIDGLKEVAALRFSRASEKPTRWVLAKRKDWKPAPDVDVRIGCELPHFAEFILAKARLPFPYSIRPIYGSEEQCVRDGIIDMVVVVTESGSSITQNGLQILEGCDSLFESTPVIVSRPGIGDKQESLLKALSAALRSVLSAKQNVMVLFDLLRSVDIAALGLPSAVAPTVSPLTDEHWCSCTVCIPLSEQGRVIALLEDAGARGVAVMPLQGYVA